MAIVSTNTSKTSINKILDVEYTSNSVNLLDYVVDSHSYNGNKDFTDQTNSAYLFQIKLFPNIDKMIKERVVGYQLYIQNLSDTTKNQLHTFSFFDDFPDLINTGEKDLDAFADNIKLLETVLVSDAIINSDTYGSETLNGVDLGDEAVSTHLKNTTLEEISKTFLEMGIDPDDSAQLAMPSFPVASTNFSFASDATHFGFGDDLKKSVSIQIPMTGDRLSLGKMRSKLINKKKIDLTRVPGPWSSLKTSRGRSTQDLNFEKLLLGSDSTSGKGISLGTVITVKSRYFESIREIEIPNSALQGTQELLFGILPLFDQSTQDDEAILEPDLSRLAFDVMGGLKTLFDPVLAPEITVFSNNKGKICFSISKNDPATSEIIVTSDYYDPNKGKWVSAGNSKSLIFSSGLESQEIINFNCRNYDPYMVRLTACVKSKYGASSLSTNLLVASHPSDNVGNFSPSDRVTIDSTNSEIGIIIHVFFNNTPASSVSVYREDLSAPLSSNVRTILLKTLDMADREREEEAQLEDRHVISGRIYRYFTVCQFLAKNKGSIYESITSANDVFIERKHLDSADLYNFTVSQRPSPVGNSFISTLKFKETDFSILLNRLKQSGLSNIFLEEIKKKKNRLTDAAFFLVDRIDCFAGERELIGHAEPNKAFIDVSASPYKKYRYVFKLALMNIESSFALSGADLQEGNHTDQDFRNAVKTFKSHVTKMTGVLPSSQEAFNPGNKSLLMSSDTGKEVTIDVTPLDDKPKPNLLGASLSNSGYLLRWSIPVSALLEVDCFYVYCVYQGKETVIQTVSSPASKSAYGSSPGTFVYTDHEYISEIGTKIYYVRAKYTNFTLGPKSNELKLVKFTPYSPSQASVIHVISTETTLDSRPIKNKLIDIIPTGGPFKGTF